MNVHSPKIGGINQSFDPRNFFERIGKVSRTDGEKANERAGIGREAYAFSAEEDRAFYITKEVIKNILKNFLLKNNSDYEIVEDALGNIFVKILGEDKESKQIIVGSHLDSVENGGKYDGVAGISAGIEILQDIASLKADGKLQKSFMLAVFRSEESSPHNGKACLGSSYARGLLSQEELESIVYDQKGGLTLKDHFVSRYGREKKKGAKGSMLRGNEALDSMIDDEFNKNQNLRIWENVINGLKTPTVTPENTESYYELHIEQGSLIQEAKAQLGIVSGGIGGSSRFRYNKPIKREILNTPHTLYTLRFLGTANHTGSTPNDKYLLLKSNTPEYRQDALKSVAFFSTLFLKKGLGNIVSLTSKGDTGFTTIPHNVSLKIAIPNDKKDKFESYLQNFREQRIDGMRDENGEFKLGSEGKLLGTQLQISEIGSGENTQIISELESKLFFKNILKTQLIAGSEFKRQSEDPAKKFGTTRATITNVQIDETGISYNLDMREVNIDDFTRLKQKIFYILDKAFLSHRSTKSHTPVNTLVRDTLIKTSNTLGLSHILIPSIPGHDADRIGAIDNNGKSIPIGMVFVRHPGLSHNPREEMAFSDYTLATKVLKETVIHQLV